MPFVAYYLDSADAGEARAQHRDAHIAYRRALGKALLLAGPLLSGDGGAVGSLLVFEADSLAEAERWAKDDPYVNAKVFERVNVHGWRIVANTFAAAPASPS